MFSTQLQTELRLLPANCEKTIRRVSDTYSKERVNIIFFKVA